MKFKVSNIYLIVAVVGFVCTAIPFFLNLWMPFLYLVLILSLASFSYWCFDHKDLLLAFLNMKSTRSGLNNGASIVLALFFILGLNFLAVKYNKSIDITSDKINTLSEESIKVVRSLTTKTLFKVYYQGSQHTEIKLKLKKIFGLYLSESKNLDYEFIDAHADPSAAEFLTTEDRNQVVVFISSGEKKERISDPITEESLTTGLIRLNTLKKFKVYFTKGHGEKSLSEESLKGLSKFKELLLSRGIQSEEISLLNLKNAELPQDLSALILIGPTKRFLEAENKILNQFAEDGGRLLFALDPESEDKFLPLFKRFGFSVNQDFVVSVRSMIPLFALGEDFDKDSEIVSGMANGQVLFPIASSISLLDKTSSKIAIEEIVKTSEYSFVAKTPTEVQRTLLKISEKGSMEGSSLAMGVHAFGALEKPEELHMGHSHASFKEGSEAHLIVFSDSDFISNEHIDQFFNKDLVLNSVSFLTGQNDLISIRPNMAKPTPLNLTPTGLNVGAMVSFVPSLFFFGLAAFYWFRRRAL